MAGRRLARLVLRDEERSELTALASRRKTAQALALRARIGLAVPRQREQGSRCRGCMWIKGPSASGGGALSSGG